jgi:hypothetical protein
MLVITDREKAIAVAGVMGGGLSEISPETDSIVLESANFDLFLLEKLPGSWGCALNPPCGLKNRWIRIWRKPL